MEDHEEDDKERHEEVSHALPLTRTLTLTRTGRTRAPAREDSQNPPSETETEDPKGEKTAGILREAPAVPDRVVVCSDGLFAEAARDSRYATTWSSVLDRIRTKVDDETFERWFRDAVFLQDMENGIVSLRARDQEAAEWLSEHYGWLLHDAIAEETDSEVEGITVVV